MNAVIASSASETTWNVTRSRLCRLSIRLRASCFRRRHGARRAFDQCGYLVAEPPAAESLGVRANDRSIEASLKGAIDRLGERSGALVIDQNTRCAVDHGFQRAAAGEGNHGPPNGLRFKRSNAKVFFPGQKRHR